MEKCGCIFNDDSILNMIKCMILKRTVFFRCECMQEYMTDCNMNDDMKFCVANASKINDGAAAVVVMSKEKAEQLVNSFVPQVIWKMGQEDIMQRAKQCALIAVNEILEDRKEVDGMRVINDPYWLDVKQELEKL